MSTYLGQGSNLPGGAGLRPADGMRAGGPRPQGLTCEPGMSDAALLGANCLASLFLHGPTLVEAHRAALDGLAAAGFRLTEISQPGLLTLRAAAPVRRYADELGIAVWAVHAPPMRRDLTLGRQQHAAL